MVLWAFERCGMGWDGMGGFVLYLDIDGWMGSMKDEIHEAWVKGMREGRDESGSGGWGWVGLGRWMG